MVGAKTLTIGDDAANGPITDTVVVGVAFQSLQTLAFAVGAAVGPEVVVVVVVVEDGEVKEVHAALITPPRTVIPSPIPTVDPPPRVITTDEGESHRHPWALLTFAKANSNEQFQVATVIPPPLVAAVKSAVMVDPSLENCAERNLGGGAGLVDERTSKESP